jgi:hypothetical protein
MECNCSSYRTSYNTWLFFYKDFDYFITEDFNRLGQYHLEELRSQLKETYRSSTNKDINFDRFMARFEALLIKALLVDTNKPAIPVETDEPVETGECNEPAILFANVIEPLMGTSTVDYCFTGSSIPVS